MKIYKKWVLGAAMAAGLLGFSLNSHAQCKTAGSPVIFTNTGANTAAGYTTTYVLTDNAGVILQASVASGFAAPSVNGTYAIYTVNYETSAAPVFTPGNNISAVTGPCIDKSSASFCVQGGCILTGGSITFTAAGQNTDASYETRYVLTDASGVIISTNTASPITAPATAGTYLVYVVNYNTANGAVVPTLTAGTAITAAGGDCADISATPMTVCVNTPLPVKLVSFSAAREGTVAQLKWASTEEINADRFDIQRSSDAKAWATIGEKKAAGDSKALVNYNFTDATPLTSLNYYRLKMIDRDATFAYSSIKSVQMNGDAAAGKLTIYPNPVSDILFLKDAAGLALDAKTMKEVAIINANGVTAYKSTSISKNGIHVGYLTKGIYIVKVTKLDGTASSHKIMITK